MKRLGIAAALVAVAGCGDKKFEPKVLTDEQNQKVRQAHFRSKTSPPFE